MARRSPAVARAIALLNLLAQHPDRSFALSELARELELNKATAHALLTTLRDARYVERDDRTMAYTLGPALVALGQAVLTHDHLVHLGRRAIERLPEEIGYPGLLSIIVDDELVVVGVAGPERVQSDRPREGARLPMVPPLGTAFVAWWSDDRVDQWLAKLEQPLSDDEVAEYHGLLATIRERGYSVDLSDLEVQLQVFLEAIARSHEDGLRAAAAELANRIAHLQAYNFREFADGDTYHVAAMSVPVFGTDGTVAATITALVEERVTGERIRTIGTRLLELAAGVDEQLGVTPPATGTTDGTSRRSPASRRSR